jgi:hypothetical protein
LYPRESKELLGKLPTALNCREHLIEAKRELFVSDAPADQIQIAADDHQQIIEVMR